MNIGQHGGYNRWENFQNIIQKAQVACANSNRKPLDHFRDITKMIKAGKGAKRNVVDYELSRYACYLIVQNADPAKPIVALGQTYFAEQTRRQELEQQWQTLPEAQKRLALRGEINVHNTNLSQAARQSGVVESVDFAIFYDYGYMGLYGGLKAADIGQRKHLGEKEQILDHMGSDELAANIFRASQTKQKLEREQVQGKEAANQTHLEVGREVRNTIQRLGGTMPEDLPTPAESIQQLQKREEKRLKQGPQTSMFGNDE